MDIRVSIYIYLSIYLSGGFPGDASGKEPTCQWRKPLEEGMATHSSILT